MYYVGESVNPSSTCELSGNLTGLMLYPYCNDLSLLVHPCLTASKNPLIFVSWATTSSPQKCTQHLYSNAQCNNVV